MENGFELDFPGDDDNAELPAWARPVVVPRIEDIGEPDFASNDEMPRVITQVENMELVFASGADCDFGCMPMDHGIAATTTTVRPSTGGKHSVSFTTPIYHGTSAVTVRLTIDEMAAAVIAMERYINGN